MRRRRDEGHARCGVAGLADGRVHFAARQMPAFAGLGALGTLDLDFTAVNEVVSGDAEASGGYLFDFIIDGNPIFLREETFRVLAAFAGVASAAQDVHGFGDTFVGFLAKGAVAHGAGAEVMDDGVHAFHFFDGDAAAGRVNEFQEVAKADQRFIDFLRIFFVDFVAPGAASPLQEADGFGV